MLTIEEVQDYVKGKTVALVGNAASYIGLEFGPDIDSHDIVVRFNMGFPDPGVAGDWGIDFNVWAGVRGWGDTPPPDNPKALPQRQLGLGPWSQTLDQVWMVPWSTRPVRPELLTKTYHLASEWLQSSRDLGHIRPTSGFVVAYMLGTSCEPAEVSLFGFDFFQGPSRVCARESAVTAKNQRKRARERAWIQENTEFVIR